MQPYYLYYTWPDLFAPAPSRAHNTHTHTHTDTDTHTHLVVSRRHGLVDLLELGVVRAQELEGFGHGGHGGGGGADVATQLLKGGPVQRGVLLLGNTHMHRQTYTQAHTHTQTHTHAHTHNPPERRLPPTDTGKHPAWMRLRPGPDAAQIHHIGAHSGCHGNALEGFPCH